MALLSKTQEIEISNPKTRPPDSLALNLPPLLSTIGKEIARLRQSIEPLTETEIDITAMGDGYYRLTPNSQGIKHIDRVGFPIFAKAVELAMIPQSWGIVHRISPETNSIEIYIPRAASQRE